MNRVSSTEMAPWKRKGDQRSWNEMSGAEDNDEEGMRGGTGEGWIGSLKRAREREVQKTDGVGGRFVEERVEGGNNGWI